MQSLRINAFHIAEDARAEAEAHTMTNGTAVPADFAALVSLVQSYRARGPIIELLIACHGTLGSLYLQSPDDPLAGGTIVFHEPFGRVHVGSSDEVLSARAFSAGHARDLAIALGQCVETGGRIFWQACFVGRGEGDDDFIRAFSELAPHVTVAGSTISTNVGADRLNGPALDFTRSGTYHGVDDARPLLSPYSAEVCRNGRCVRTSTSLYGRLLLRSLH